jgi:hypothetical protein
VKSTTTINRLELENRLSFLVFVILDGTDRILAHTRTYERAVDMVLNDAEVFEADHGRAEYRIDGHTLTAVYADGIETTYRIDPSDRQIPEDEPAVHEVDSTRFAGLKCAEVRGVL